MNRTNVLLVVAALLMASLARGATNTWVASGTNDWFDTNNWNTLSVPAAGDDVIIAYTNVGVRRTNATVQLGSFTISNKATLIFYNWDTALNATNVTIATNASMTCSGPFTDGAMSNRVWLACTNLTVAAGGSVNVDGRGFAGGGASQNGHGPGYGRYGTLAGSGGGYGGYGGRSYQASGGVTYGSVSNDLWPGSGGAGRDGYGSGGAGGGLVRIEATNAVQINGSITANGAVASYGAGSGGGIFIKCRNFGGAVTGSLTATGGSKGDANNGAGGGGRIAVWYMYNTYQGTFSVEPGSGGYTNVPASTPRAGTMVWFQLPLPGTIFTMH